MYKCLVGALCLLASWNAFAASPLRCTITIVQPQQPGSTQVFVAPEHDLVIFELSPNEEKTLYFNVKKAVASPVMPQYTPITAADKASATFYAGFSKTDVQNGNTPLPDGAYGVNFGLVGNSQWMWGGGDFSMAANVSLEPKDGKGIAVLTCTETERN